MRVTVDRDLCEANGVCAGLVPQVFRLDDDDELHITDGEVQVAREGHEIAHDVKDRLMERIVPIKDVLVHIEPGKPGDASDRLLD